MTMKKSTKRLALSTQTIRALQADDLARVAGGSVTISQSGGTSVISQSGTSVMTTSVISKGH